MVEAEFVEALQECGTISSVVVMPKRRQALVEFEDVLEARNAMNYATDNQIELAGCSSFCQLFYPLENLPPPGLG